MSETDRTSPLHPEHPKHPDNHPLRAHHPHHPLVHQITGFYILFALFAAVLTGFLTNAPFGSVLLGFAPAVVLGLIVLALAAADHLDITYLSLALFATLLAAGFFFAQALPGADLASLLGINFVLCALFILIIQQSYAHHEEVRGSDAVEIPGDERELSKVFADIEEKAKSLNTAIGRAYSVYRGASASMREKIKVPSSLYGQLDAEKKPSALKQALEQVVERLSLMERSEKEVFSQAEVKKLERSGSDRVVDVLADSEGEGVLQAHASARSYAESALERVS